MKWHETHQQTICMVREGEGVILEAKRGRGEAKSGSRGRRSEELKREVWSGEEWRRRGERGRVEEQGRRGERGR